MMKTEVSYKVFADVQRIKDNVERLYNDKNDIRDELYNIRHRKTVHSVKVARYKVFKFNLDVLEYALYKLGVKSSRTPTQADIEVLGLLKYEMVLKNRFYDLTDELMTLGEYKGYNDTAWMFGGCTALERAIKDGLIAEHDRDLWIDTYSTRELGHFLFVD